jgi:hypothetical protein
MHRRSGIISKTELPKAAMCRMSHTHLATVAEVPALRKTGKPATTVSTLRGSYVAATVILAAFNSAASRC